MNQEYVINKLVELGFERRMETLWSKFSDYTLFTTLNQYEIFAYYENGNFYFSDNGDLVETFDAPDIDIEFMDKKIKYEIKKYGCYLNSSKIVKEIRVQNIERDLKYFTHAVNSVDNMYKNL